MLRRLFEFILSLFIISTLAPVQSAEPLGSRITTPKAHFGFNLGDDYCLANYEQYAAYLARLEKESDRVKVVNTGDTAEKRPQLMAIVTSPANHKKLDRYREIARKLATAEGISSEEAAKLTSEGKAIVWIDGGLHASEVLCAQAMAEMIYQLASAGDSETLRILDDVVILFVHANPDGMDLCADWYMREKDTKKRSSAALPRLYQKYIGHDNNRDFYANTQAETRNMNRVMYREWFPQIVYNHHQTGPPGTVLFCPPFRDPFNYNCDPLVISGVDALGAAMMQRFLAEDKPGATSRSGARYSTWFNGGLRTTAYFHNMIGLLTETIGTPTPMRIPFTPGVQLPKADYLAPVAPQEWHFRHSVEYSVTANKAVLDYASRNREPLLHNIWLMGKNAIERGNKDSWTVTPKVVAAAKGTRGEAEFKKFFRDPAKRDARGYIVPADQPDFLTATKFINTLIGTGLKVHRATAPFEVGGKKYPLGSYVVLCAQAFRAHVVDMFEPQDHPDDFAYPGAQPTPPYDAAGWTLAFQMGVKFDRVLEGFNGPFELLENEVFPPPAKVLFSEKAAGFFLAVRSNEAFHAVNQLLAAGEDVRRLKEPATVDGVKHLPGMFFVMNNTGTVQRLEKIAATLGTRFFGSQTIPGKEAVQLKTARIALWDRYGGSMPSGWTRWLLEQFEFPFTVVYPPDLDKGNLSEKFDVIVLVDGAFSTGKRGMDGDQPPQDGSVVDELGLPAEYRGRRGSITTTKTVPELKKFLESGGTILAIGSSTAIAKQLDLTLENHLVSKDADGKEKPLGRDKFYVPPSILRVKLDMASPLAWGLEDEVDMMFDNSPTFRLPGAPEKAGLTRVAWFASKTPLRSGWAFGQEYLDGGVAVVDARVGKGRLVLYGPPVLFRAQPHGTFKLFFNGIVRASEKSSQLNR
jgi:hypothetical protein